MSNNEEKEKKEKKDLLDAYDQVQKFYILNNESYFKRTQILMIVIQSALFLTFAKFLGADAIKASSSNATNNMVRVVLLVVISFLGILGAYAWREMIERQGQRLEFCRYYMRSIESKLQQLKVPLRYCTKEKEVFYSRKPVCLGQNGEYFPYENVKIKGSVIDIERGITRFLFIFWGTILVAIGCFVCVYLMPGLWPEGKLLFLVVMFLLLSVYLALLLLALIRSLSRRLGGGTTS